jgi:26S proteasome regulatory subunit N12
LEIGAFYSLKVRDVSAFARYEAMLSGYYRDFKWVELSAFAVLQNIR